MKKSLKVGFDLDGVILYNPARIARAPLAFIWTQVFKKEKREFYIPKSKPEELFWYLLHKTSLFPARGYNKLKELVEEGKIEAYLITGRYHALESDFDEWIEKLDAKKYFAQAVYNDHNEQPHVFKKRMIEKFNLDIFVEDNWDIIRLLNNKKERSFKIFWLSNLLDRFIPYPYKFFSFREVVDYLSNSF